MEQKTTIPDFMKQAYEASDEEGKVHLDNLARSYDLERQKFMQTTYASQANFQADWNRTTGQRGTVDADAILKPMQEKYTASAQKIAGEYRNPDLREEQKNAFRENAGDMSESQATEQGRESQSETEQRRAAFLQNLEDVKQRNQQRLGRPLNSDTQDESKSEAQPASSGQTTDEPLSERDKFLANMKALRANSADHQTHPHQR